MTNSVVYNAHDSTVTLHLQQREPNYRECESMASRYQNAENKNDSRLRNTIRISTTLKRISFGGTPILELLLVLLLMDGVSGRLTPGENSGSSTSLEIQVSAETAHGAQIQWITPAKIRHKFSICWLHYGPLTEAVHVQTQVKPAESRIVLDHLSSFTTYYAFLSCKRGRVPYTSNTVHFTPHGDPEESGLSVSEEDKSLLATLKSPIEPRQEPLYVFSPLSSSLSARRPAGEGLKSPDPNSDSQEDEGILVLMNERHMNYPRRDPHNSSLPASLVLGVVCGVVGFLIINVTVVMVVRQYSHRRARRRRLLELHQETVSTVMTRGQETVNTVLTCGQETVNTVLTCGQETVNTVLTCGWLLPSSASLLCLYPSHPSPTSLLRIHPPPTSFAPVFCLHPSPPFFTSLLRLPSPPPSFASTLVEEDLSFQPWFSTTSSCDLNSAPKNLSKIQPNLNTSALDNSSI
ncbi:Fibronectin type III [Trinorchestia longiramus]|nr:Fibronectin type III [Trinorchestia longiramus]